MQIVGLFPNKGPDARTPFSYFILIINFKISAIADILTFIGIIYMY